MSRELIRLESSSGMVEAEILRGMLEAYGIQVQLVREAAGPAIGLTFGPLARVDLMVYEDQEAEARQILDDYRAGRFAAED